MLKIYRRSLTFQHIENILKPQSAFLSSCCVSSWNENVSACASIHPVEKLSQSRSKFLQLAHHATLQHQQTRGYAMRLELSEYGILWRRPEKVPVWKPEKAGDLAPFEKVDVTHPLLSMLPVAKELENASEKAKKLLSLEFSSEKDVIELARYRMKRRVQRHQFDESSHEVLIALMTCNIRHLQIYVEANPKRTRARILLQEIIDKRRSRLTQLRKADYRRFEWLLEELNLFYKPTPANFGPISRKASLQKLVQLHCESMRNQRLEQYRMELEAMKKPFLEEKRETLQWIAETEKKLGLPISVEIPDNEGTKLLSDSVKVAEECTKKENS